MVARETVSFVFPRVPMFPETKSRETSGFEGKQTYLVSRGTILEVFCYIARLSLEQSYSKNTQDGVRATTAQLYPGRETFEFDQRHVTKNQPITVLILLSESLAI